MDNRTRAAGLLVAVLLAAFAVLAVLTPGLTEATRQILTAGNTYSAALRLAVPLVLAGLGGMLSEKSGLINIGLEGLLIVGAFVGVFTVSLLGAGTTVAFLPVKWVGVLAATVVTALFSLIFGIICIEFDANQIIAGLALWLVGLGLAPFLAVVYYGGPNSGGSVGTLGTWTIPGLSAIPFVGDILFSASPFVYIMLASVVLVWVLLNRTKYGRWIRASGENPEALDTAGVDVNRVRYGTTILSGVLSGLGGVGLSLGQVGLFIGTGGTMVNGRGFIAITTYLFGNYTPGGTLVAALFFGGLDAIQTQLQSLPVYDVPDQLVRTIPYVAVIVVLVFIGQTRLPSAAGENYQSGEE
jgi:simple sugar transport system permease protein